MNSKIFVVVCAIFLCTIQPVLAEDFERSKESRPQVESNIQDTSSKIKVEGYVTAPPLKLEIKGKIPAQIKLEVIEERKENATERAELRDVQKTERIQPHVEKYRKQSTTLNETYRQELKEAIRNGSTEEVMRIRQEYMEKRKVLNREIVEQSKARTLTETQKQKDFTDGKKTERKNLPQSIQEWRQNVTSAIQSWWLSVVKK
jgi:hypothetical protein